MVLHSQRELLAMFRARLDQLNISLDTLDELAGLPTRYATKILANVRVPEKQLGAVSFDSILGALGLRLVAEEDPEAMARIAGRLEPRRYAKAKNAGVGMLAFRTSKRRGFSPLRGNPGLARMMRLAQLTNQSKDQRSSVARKAAIERWRKARTATAYKGRKHRQKRECA